MVRTSVNICLLALVFLFQLPADSPPPIVPQVGRGLSGAVLAMSPDGRYIAESGGVEPFVRLWTAEGVFLRSIETPLSLVWSAAFTGDNRLLVSGSSNPYTDPDESPDAYILDLEGRILESAPPSLICCDVIAPHADGHSIWISGTRYDTDGVWISGVFLLNEDLSFRTIYANSNDLFFHALQIRPGGAYLVKYWYPDASAGDFERTHRLGVFDERTEEFQIFEYFDSAGYTPKGIFPREDGGLVLVLAFDPDSLNPKENIRILQFDGRGSSPRIIHEELNVVFERGFTAPDGRFFASLRHEREYHSAAALYVKNNFSLSAWDIGGFPIPLPKELTDGFLGCFAGDRNGRILAAGENRAFILSEEFSIDGIIAYPPLDTGLLRFSPSGDRLYAVGDSLRIWDISGKLLKTIPIADWTSDFTVKDDGTLIRLFIGGFEVYDADGCFLRKMNWETILSKNGYEIDESVSSVYAWPIISGKGVISFIYDEYSGRFFIDDTGTILVEDRESVLPENIVFSSDGSLVFSIVEWMDSESTIYGFDWNADGKIREVSADHPVMIREREFCRALLDRYEDDPWGHGVPETGRMRPFAYSPAGTQFVTAGMDGMMRLWDRDNRMIGEFSGHGAPILSLAFHPGGEVVATASEDGSIRLWNINTGDSAAMYSHGKEWLICTPDGYFDCSPKGDELAVYLSGDRAVRLSQFALFRNRPDVILSRLNLGNPEAREDWRTQYLRRLAKSEALPVRIPIKDFGEILNLSNARQGRLLTMAYGRSDGGYVMCSDLSPEDRFGLLRNPVYLAYVEKRFLEDWDLPKVEVESSRVDEDDNVLLLKLRFSSESTELNSYSIAVNGVPLYGGQGLPLEGYRDTAAAEVPLLPGRNAVEVSCFDKLGRESLGWNLQIDREIPKEEKPRGILWFLGFGVSEYRDECLHLVFPAKDVRDLEVLFSSFSGNFDGFRSRIWIDGNCTVSSIAEGRDFLTAASPEDTVVLFISGHGLHDDEGAYYYLSSEADLDDLENTSIPFSLLSGLLDGIPPRKKLFLMDTCESGEVDPARLESSNAFLEDEKTRSRSIRSSRIRVPDTLEPSGKTMIPANPLIPSAALEAHDWIPDKGIPIGISPEGVSSRGLGSAGIKPRSWRLERDRMIHRDIFQRTGAVVFSSSRGGELSYEPYSYSEEGNGFFTGAVIAALDGLVSDLNADGFITAGELEASVFSVVAGMTDGLQNPVIDRDNLLVRLEWPVSESALNLAVPEILNSSLLSALHNGQADWAAVLASHGAVLETSVMIDELVSAASEGDAAICRFLLGLGAAPNLSGSLGIPPVRAALMGFHKDVLWVLMEGGSVIPPDAVVWAEADGRLSFVTGLLERGSHMIEEGAVEALTRAAASGFTEAVALLLKEGTATFDRFIHDYSPLEYAVRGGYTDIVALLLDAGAPIEERYCELARKAGNEEIVTLLERALGKR